MKVISLSYLGNEIVVKIVCEVCGSAFVFIGHHRVVMCSNCGELEYIGDIEQELQNLIEEGES